MDTRPSRTAEYMALFRALETARPPGERLFEDPWAERFLGRRLTTAARMARLPLVGGAVPRLIDRRWPGPRPSAVARTRMIDDLVTAAVAGGATELVLLGAGYDTRGIRLPGARALTTWEVDHPATQARKRSRLGVAGAAIHYVPVDFERQDLGHALANAGLEAGSVRCVVWEGVFSYLTIDAIDATLACVTDACAPGSRLAVTYVDAAALEGPEAAWVTAVPTAGEPFVTGLEPGDAASFFAARHLELLSDRSTRGAAEDLLPAETARTIPGFYRVAETEVTL